MKHAIARALVVVLLLSVALPAYADSPCASVYRYDRATLNALATYYETASKRKTTYQDLKPALAQLNRSMAVFKAFYSDNYDGGADSDAKFAACDPEARFIDYDARAQMVIALGRVSGGDISPTLLQWGVYYIARMIAVGKKTGQVETLLPDMVHRLQALYGQQHLSQPQGLIDAAAAVDAQTDTSSPPLDGHPTPEPTP